jgi:[acyl-carrier-protein] S-malonyltransferase
MATAAEQFQQVLNNVSFGEAIIPVLSNVNPIPTVDAAELKNRLIDQMTNPVRWRETLLQLAEEGVSQLVEVGPGNVLTGLCKRTCPDIQLHNIASAENCQF